MSSTPTLAAESIPIVGLAAGIEFVEADPGEGRQLLEQGPVHQPAQVATRVRPMLKGTPEQHDLTVASWLRGDGRRQRHALAVPGVQVAGNLLESDVDADDGPRTGGCRPRDGRTKALGEEVGTAGAAAAGRRCR